MKTLTITAALIAALTGSLAASEAAAHARLLKSSPAESATVASPKALHLEFSEALEPRFSAVTLMTSAGKPVAVASKASGKVIDATPKAALAPGGYMVMWSIVSADGHKMKGQYLFNVK